MKSSELRWGAFINFLLAQVGKPYVFGTENDPTADPASYPAWDCSELVEIAFKKIGIVVPDGSYNQAKIVKPVEFDQLQIGDLGFLAHPDNGVIHHVGIYIGDRVGAGDTGESVPTMIEAKGKKWGVILTPAKTFAASPDFVKWGRLRVIQDA